jgi:hypothetical protein
MPSSAKGRNVYQGSTAVLTASEGAGPADPRRTLDNQLENNVSEEAVEESDQIDMPVENVDMGEGSSTAVGRSGRSDVEGVDDDDEDNAPATSPPPSPSIASKRRFSAIDSETVSTSRDSDMLSPSASARVTPTSRSLVSSNSSSSKRGRVTGAIALANIGHNFADFNTMYRVSLDRQEARHQQRAAKRSHQEEDPMSIAMEHVQETESDLTPDELAGLIDVFQKERDSARAYLLIKNDSIRKAWIKRKLASISGPSVQPQ